MVSFNPFCNRFSLTLHKHKKTQKTKITNRWWHIELQGVSKTEKLVESQRPNTWKFVSGQALASSSNSWSSFVITFIHWIHCQTSVIQVKHLTFVGHTREQIINQIPILKSEILQTRSVYLVEGTSMRIKYLSFKTTSDSQVKKLLGITFTLLSDR